MADPLYPLRGRLEELEDLARPLRAGALPPVLVVPVCRNDSATTAWEYANELADVVGEEAVVVLLSVLAQRAPESRPAWEHPRRWLDVATDEPCERLVVLGNGRGDASLSDQDAPRIDFRGAPLSRDHAERVARAAARWEARTQNLGEAARGIDTPHAAADAGADAGRPGVDPSVDSVEARRAYLERFRQLQGSGLDSPMTPATNDERQGASPGAQSPRGGGPRGAEPTRKPPPEAPRLRIGGPPVLTHDAYFSGPLGGPPRGTDA